MQIFLDAFDSKKDELLTRTEKIQTNNLLKIEQLQV